MARKKSLNLSSQVSKDCLSQEQLNKKISDVAYSIFKKRNFAPGNDLGDWLEAEKIVIKSALNFR